MDWNSINYQFWNTYSIKDAICDACGGKLKFTSKSIKAERRALCNECEFKNKFGFCRKCGCKINWKTALAKSKCPLGIW